MIAEIQVAPSPAGTPEDPHAYVEAAVRVIQASGLRHEVGALGTTLEGDDDAVWATLQDGGDDEAADLWEQLAALHAAAQQVAAAGSPDQVTAATAAVTEARKTIYRLLAE